MSKRHEVIGLKQAIRLEWMEKAANLLLAGLDAKTIREELQEYLSDKRVTGVNEKRSNESRNQIVGILMKAWVLPEPEITTFRNVLLTYLREYPAMGLNIHWAMLSAAYPFWYNVARQTGRLLHLQDQVTQTQIIKRLKELYGDRQTVSRYARFVIRSFVAWGVLKDSDAKGCYEIPKQVVIKDAGLGILMIESALHANPDAKDALGLIMNNPAFFPFQLPSVTGDFISQRSERIDVVRYGLDDELLRLKSAG